MKLLIVCIFLFTISGCSSSSKLNRTALNYNIMITSGGGFTGNYDGVTIDTAGNIKTWSGKTIESAVFKKAGSLTDEEITEINELMIHLRLFEIEYSKPGNISQSLTLIKNSTEHRFSWEGFTPGADVPANLKLFYSKINEIIRNHK